MASMRMMRKKYICFIHWLAHNVKGLYFLTFVVIWSCLTFIAGLIILCPITFLNCIQYLILISINIGLSHELTQIIWSFVLPTRGIPRLRLLKKYPKVALLYVTRDDACEFSLDSLAHQCYPGLDIYILDDSCDPDYQRILEKYAYPIIRRMSHAGFKAGNLNYWIKNYGHQYDYFSVMDSDSILPPDFILNMIKIAECPAHRNIAFFQSVPLIWNYQNRFVATMATMNKSVLFPILKLANSCQMILSWGHNDLVRTDVILANGGYNERFIGEDYATALDVRKLGYGCMLVDVVSFEAHPNDFRSYTSRVARWAKSTMQIVLHHPKIKVPFYNWYVLLMNAHSFFSWFLYLPGMLISVWAFQSSLGELGHAAKSGYLINGRMVLTIGLFGFYMATFVFLKLPLARKHGVGMRAYFRHWLLNLCLGYFAAIPIIIGQLQVFLGRNIVFDVTRKNQERIRISRIFTESKGMLIVVGLLIMGVVLVNPLSGLFGFLWMMPMLIYPFVLFYYSNDGLCDREWR